MKLVKEITAIIVLSTIIALFVNWKISPTPLPWVHPERIVDSTSNATLDAMIIASTSTNSNPANTPASPNSGQTVDNKTNTNVVASPTPVAATQAGDKAADLKSKPAPPTTTTSTQSSAPAQATPKVETPSKLPIAVTYEQVMKLLSTPNAVTFIDARKAEEHQKSAIPGSVNIDVLNFQADPQYRGECMKTLYSIPKDKIIVSYCGGGNCELSHELCDILIPMGFKKVLIYLGGMNEYSEKQGLNKK